VHVAIEANYVVQIQIFPTYFGSSATDLKKVVLLFLYSILAKGFCLLVFAVGSEYMVID